MMDSEKNDSSGRIGLPIDSRREFEDSPTGRLALSLFPADPSGRSFMLLNAYYDESGTHAGSPFTVMAGFMGQVEDWIAFDREWRKVLKKYGLAFVRAKHLFHRQKQHKGWTEKQIEGLWNDLMYVLQERKRISITKTVLDNSLYKSIYVGGGPRKKERLDTPYALCVRSCLHFHPYIHHHRYRSGSVNFILEAGHRNAGDAVRAFDELKRDESINWRDRLGSISFGTKPDFPALQAADLVAYWFYKNECEKREDDSYEWRDISDLEMDLASCGLDIVEHLITHRDLQLLRHKFITKRSNRRLFGKARMVLNESKYFYDERFRGLTRDLVGLEFSLEELEKPPFHIARPTRQD